MEQKIETFLAQIKSLDALSLSMVEEIRMLKAQNEALKVQNDSLNQKLIVERNSALLLQEEVAQLRTQTPLVEEEPKKPKKAPRAQKIEATPSLF